MPRASLTHMLCVTPKPQAHSNEDMVPQDASPDHFPLVGEARPREHTNPTGPRALPSAAPLAPRPTHQVAAGSVQTRTVWGSAALLEDAGQGKGGGKGAERGPGRHKPSLGLRAPSPRTAQRSSSHPSWEAHPPVAVWVPSPEGRRGLHTLVPTTHRDLGETPQRNAMQHKHTETPPREGERTPDKDKRTRVGLSLRRASAGAGGRGRGLQGTPRPGPRPAQAPRCSGSA